jgi:hypothetical protein
MMTGGMEFPVSMENAVNLNVQLATDDSSIDAPMADEIHLYGDYNTLNNKPTLNGFTIEGDMHEQDPTVPEWAKAPEKPQYSADDVGAIPNGAIRVLDDGDFWEMLERE